MSNPNDPLAADSDYPMDMTPEQIDAEYHRVQAKIALTNYRARNITVRTGVDILEQAFETGSPEFFRRTVAKLKRKYPLDSD